MPAIPSVYPIDEAIRKQVLAQLTRIEQQHQVSILFACESGSRGWGFASPDSDYDVRFIYVHRLPWYLAIATARDVIEVPINNDLDINGWELRKTLRLLQASNPTLLEWLDSSIIYRQQKSWVEQLRVLAKAYFSSSRAYHHYLSMAKKNAGRHLEGQAVRYKKYLYALRSLLAARWIREHGSAPPMRFAELVTHMLREPLLLDEIRALLEIKMRAGESATCPPWENIHAFIERELLVASSYCPEDLPKQDASALDGFLYETVLHAEDLN